jgi:hypothetical protein
VLLSLSGQRGPAAGAATSQARIGSLGRAVLQAVNALDNGSQVPSPSTYLMWSAKVIPAWAVRLLVLVLILPVAAATVDGAARVRRRGLPLGRWLVWTLSWAVPFVLAVLVVALARALGEVGVASPTPVQGGTVPLGSSGLLTLVGLGLVIAGGLVWLRPLVVHLAGPSPRQRAKGAQRAAAAAALLLVLCAVALAVWWTNPFAALLLLPALHLWLWVVVPDVRLPTPVSVALLVAGLALPALALAYYAVTLGLGPVGVAWSWVLLLTGGAVSWSAAIAWSVVLGCALGAVVIAVGYARAPAPEAPPITVRGPVTYAGPGSLGGTKSALRR